MPWKDITTLIGVVTAGTASLLYVVFQHHREIRRMELAREANEKGTNGATERSLRELVTEIRALSSLMREHIQFVTLSYKPNEWDAVVAGVSEMKGVTNDTRRLVIGLLDRDADEES